MAGKLPKFSYQKLRKEVISDEDQEHESKERKVDVNYKRSSSLSRISWFGKLKKRKLRIKFSGFKRFFKIRRIKGAGSLSFSKILKRLKESQSHLGDIFAGNYLFMQVSPASLKSNTTNCVVNPNINYNHVYNNYNGTGKFPGFSHFNFMY